MVDAALHVADAILNRAALQGAVIAHSVFADADLRLAVLRGAVVSDAEGLMQAQLDEACGDAETRLPEGLTIPAC